MQFRRSGQRDDRRRRVLIDESTEAEENLTERSRKRSRAKIQGRSSNRSYPDEAWSELQLRFVDVLPKRKLVLAAFLLVAIGTIVTLNALYIHVPHWSACFPAGSLKAFDLSEQANLLVWLSSTLLLLGAIASLQVYTLRRHRIDDYRGSYRLWVWAAAVLLFASIDATAQFHLLISGALVQATGSALNGDAVLWSAIVYGIVMGGFGIRLAIEMRHSRAAIVSLLAATLSYGTGVLLQLDQLVIANAVPIWMVPSTALAVGHLAVLLAIWCYARVVYFDVHGELLPRPTTTQKKRADTGSTADRFLLPGGTHDLAAIAVAELNDRIDHEELSQLEEQFDDQRRSRRQRKAKRDKSSDPQMVQDDYDNEFDRCRLSKSQRKALKKHRRQRRAA